MVSTGQLVGGYILLFLSNTLSSSAGVGGGLLNVAIFHSVIGYSFKVAVVFSLAAIMGNTLVQLMINIQTRHPKCATRSVIYWDAILVMLPAELGGSNLGVLLSDIMPPTILYIGAILVLLTGAGFSAKKGHHLYELENERRREKAQKGSSFDTEVANPVTVHSATTPAPVSVDQRLPSNSFSSFDSMTQLQIGGHEGRASLSGAGKVDARDDSISDGINPLLSLPRLQMPWSIIYMLTAVWLCFLILFVVSSLVPGCSLGWGMVLLFIYLIVLVEAPGSVAFLIRDQNMHPEQLMEGDLRWSKGSISLPCVTFGIGLLTALLGFGGGELIGPYLLHLKIQPLVSTSTSGMISFLNTTLSLIHYAILGKVNYIPSIGIFVIGATAGLCGRLFALFVVKHYDRASFLIGALVCILGLSFVVFILYLATGKIDFSFGELC
jgi:uncharacterized membrane protein YfcA